MLRSHLVPLVAVIFAAAIFQVSNGALGTLLPVRLGLAAAGELATGLIATAYAGGFVVGCLIGARVIRTVGHIRAFAAFAATAAVASLMFQIAVDTTLWFVLRVIHGICIAGLSTVVDSWINERTPNAARGRVIAIYTITITLALTGSQFLIGLFDVASAQLIMVVSGLFSLALIPVSLTTARTPTKPKVVSVSVRHLYRVAPVAAVGCFAVGFMNTAVMNITPYFLSNAAVPVATIGLLMGMIQVGRLVMQWPVGWLSDKIDRRLVILAAAGGDRRDHAGAGVRRADQGGGAARRDRRDGAARHHRAVLPVGRVRAHALRGLRRPRPGPRRARRVGRAHQLAAVRLGDRRDRRPPGRGAADGAAMASACCSTAPPRSPGCWRPSRSGACCCASGRRRRSAAASRACRSPAR